MAASDVFGWVPVTLTTLASNNGVWSRPTPSATRAAMPTTTATHRSRFWVRLRSTDSLRSGSWGRWCA